jgi:hypothetical protein
MPRMLPERNAEKIRPSDHLEYVELMAQFVAESGLYITGNECEKLRANRDFSCEQCPLGYRDAIGMTCGITSFMRVAKCIDGGMKSYRERERSRIMYSLTDV